MGVLRRCLPIRGIDRHMIARLRSLARLRGDNPSLMLRLIYGFSWQTAMNLVGRAATFSIAILQARVLGKAGYGELGMVLSTLTVFGLVSSAAGGQTCTKFIAQFHQADALRAGRIAALSLILTLCFSLLATAAVFLSAPVVAVQTLGSSSFVPLLWLAGIAIAFQAGTGTISGILLGLQEFRADSLLRLVQVGCWLPLTAWLSLRWGVFGAMLAYTLSHLGGLIVYVAASARILKQRGFRLQFIGFLSEWGVVFQYSLPMMLHGLLCVPTVWICNAMLARQPGGHAALGGYTAAVQIRTIVLQLPMQLQGVVWPAMAELYGSGQFARFGRLFQSTYQVLWALGLLAALPIVAFGKALLAIFGRAFAADQGVMALVMATAALSLLSGFAGAGLQIADKTWIALYANIAYSMLSITSAYFLTPEYGAVGLGWAFVISTSVQSALLLLLIQLKFPHLHSSRNYWLALISPVFCLAIAFGPQSPFGFAVAWRLLLLLGFLAIVWIQGLAKPSRQLFQAFASTP